MTSVLVLKRRAVLASGCCLSFGLLAQPPASGTSSDRHRLGVLGAQDMKVQAQSWGDQPYGAVVVLNDRIVGQGPSRVVKNRDVRAHAEREAIRDAQHLLGRTSLHGALLYSTSRPCPMCEQVALAAEVSRMYFGASAQDAGAPAP